MPHSHWSRLLFLKRSSSQAVLLYSVALAPLESVSSGLLLFFVLHALLGAGPMVKPQSLQAFKAIGPNISEPEAFSSVNPKLQP